MVDCGPIYSEKKKKVPKAYKQFVLLLFYESILHFESSKHQNKTSDTQLIRLTVTYIVQLFHIA